MSDMVRVSLDKEPSETNRPLRGRTQRRGLLYRCEKRGMKRLLCSDLVRLSWTEPSGCPRHEVAVLENLSLAGVALFSGVPVPEDSSIEIASDGARLNGFVRRCGFRENGYLLGVELDADSRWAQQPNSGFLPEHLLDVSLLQLD